MSEQLCCEKKRKQHAPPGNDASAAEADPDRVGRGEQGEARRGDAHREVNLIASKLENGSKPGPKAAFGALDTTHYRCVSL